MKDRPTDASTIGCIIAFLAVLSNLTAACGAGLEIHFSTNTLTEVHGWGLMPAPFDRQLPTRVVMMILLRGPIQI